MVRHVSSTARYVLTTLLALAMTLVAYLGAFGDLGAWAARREPWLLGLSLAVSIVLGVAFGLYFWRAWARLRREAQRHEREVVELEGEVAELLRVRAALQREAAAYRGVIANLPGALFAVDPEGVFTLAEGTGLELLGLEPNKVVGRSIFDTYRDAPQVVENVRLALGGQASGAIVEVGGRAFEARYSPLQENSEFSGVLGVATDVTERRIAEDRLREAEARFRTLVEQIPAVTYVEELSRKGKILAYMSPQYEAMVGHSPEEGVPHPQHWLEIVHPDDRERVLAEDRRTDESLEPFRAEYRVIAKDGRIVWVSDEAVLVRDEEGKPLFWQGVVHDVTERMRAEEALREAEERYRTLVEQIPAVTYIDRITDGRDEPLYTSPQIERMLGYTPEEWVGGRLWPERLHPDDRERVLAADERFEGGEEERFSEEYRLVAKDGSVVWVREEAVLVRDGAGG